MMGVMGVRILCANRYTTQPEGLRSRLVRSKMAENQSMRNIIGQIFPGSERMSRGGPVAQIDGHR
jgi:hypothetical protein